MVEGECDEISEEDMIEALLFGHKAVQDTLELHRAHEAGRGQGKVDVQRRTAPPQFIEGSRQPDCELERARGVQHRATSTRATDRIKQIKKETVSQLGLRVPERRSASQGSLRGASLQHDARPGARRRSSPRRTRHAHRASDQHRARRAAAHPRLVAVHARRDPGHRDHHARHHARRAAPRHAAWASSTSTSCCTTTSRPTRSAK